MDYEGDLNVSEGDSGCCSSSDGQFRRRSSTVTGLSGSMGFLTSPPTQAEGGFRPPRRKRRPSYSKAVNNLPGAAHANIAAGQMETTSAESLQMLKCRGEGGGIEDDTYDEGKPLGGSGPLVMSSESRSSVPTSFYDRIIFL